MYQQKVPPQPGKWHPEICIDGVSPSVNFPLTLYYSISPNHWDWGKITYSWSVVVLSSRKWMARTSGKGLMPHFSSHLCDRASAVGILWGYPEGSHRCLMSMVIHVYLLKGQHFTTIFNEIIKNPRKEYFHSIESQISSYMLKSKSLWMLKLYWSIE